MGFLQLFFTKEMMNRFPTPEKIRDQEHLLQALHT